MVTVLVSSSPLGRADTPPPASSPSAASAQSAMTPGPPPGEATREQLEELVSPIALYPDLLIARILVASTFPDQVVQAHQWLQQNPNLKGNEFAAAVKAQPWDPSVRSLSQFPEVVKTMNDSLEWTADLGEAYYNQPDDVMSAIQRLRKRAMDAGTLKDTPQQKVEVQSPPPPAQGAAPAEGVAPGAQQVVVIQPSQPNTVYVPQYDPSTAYGAPVQQPAGYTGTEMLTTGLLSFGLGMGLGALISDDDDDDWDCGWGGGGNNNTINYNKNVYRNRGDAFPSAGGEARRASRESRRAERNRTTPYSGAGRSNAAMRPVARPYSPATAKPFRPGTAGAGRPTFPKASTLPASASLGTGNRARTSGMPAAASNRPQTLSNSGSGGGRAASTAMQGGAARDRRGFSSPTQAGNLRGGRDGAFGGYERGGFAQASGNRGRSSLLGGGGGGRAGGLGGRAGGGGGRHGGGGGGGGGRRGKR
jgi:hypothetical protein